MANFHPHRPPSNRQKGMKQVCSEHGIDFNVFDMCVKMHMRDNAYGVGTIRRVVRRTDEGHYDEMFSWGTMKSWVMLRVAEIQKESK